MTHEEAERFRAEFKELVYQKSNIKDSEIYLHNLHMWDKNGSHKNAIDKAINDYKDRKAKFNEMLNGRSYEEWLSMSKRLSAIKSKLKTSSEKVKSNQERKLAELKFY